MTYTSFVFLMFFPIGIITYWIVKPVFRKWIILLMNFIFLMTWSPFQLLFIIIFSSVTYFTGNQLLNNYKNKKIIKTAYIIIVVTFFIYLKFSNYFIGNINNFMGFSLNTLKIWMPIGFSFYMIQSLMYIIDIDKGVITKESINYFDFLIFNSFFMTLIQGPITKYQKFVFELTNHEDNSEEKFKKGLNIFVAGLFKKLMIASRLSILSNEIFGNYSSYSGRVIVIGTLAFTLELYFDFSSAVDISRGISLMLGIELPENFNNPYRALSIRDFWSRWHMTLTAFFREYIYFPLGGSKKGKLIQFRNIYIIFIVSALWHGTGLNFILWGLFHATLQVIESALQIGSTPSSKFSGFIKWLYTFTMINIGWLIFKAPGIKAAYRIIRSVFTPYNLPLLLKGLLINGTDILIIVFAIIIINLRSYPQYNDNLSLKYFDSNRVFKLSYIMLLVILIFGYYGPGFSSSDFIYMGF